MPIYATCPNDKKQMKPYSLLGARASPKHEHPNGPRVPQNPLPAAQAEYHPSNEQCYILQYVRYLYHTGRLIVDFYDMDTNPI